MHRGHHDIDYIDVAVAVAQIGRMLVFSTPQVKGYIACIRVCANLAGNSTRRAPNHYKHAGYKQKLVI